MTYKCLFVGLLGRDGQTKEVSDSVFYCEVKSSRPSSETAENSKDSDKSSILESGAEEMTGSQSVTGCNADESLEAKELNDSKENSQPLISRMKHSASEGVIGPRKTGSWEVITKKDVTHALLETAHMDDSDIAPNSHIPSQGQSSNQGKKFGQSSNHKIVQSQGPSSPQVQRSRQGQISSQSTVQGQSSSQGQEEGSGRAGKLMSTFSSLKKMRLGRRQVSETATSGKLQALVRFDTYIFSFPSQIPTV